MFLHFSTHTHTHAFLALLVLLSLAAFAAPGSQTLVRLAPRSASHSKGQWSHTTSHAPPSARCHHATSPGCTIHTQLWLHRPGCSAHTHSCATPTAVHPHMCSQLCIHTSVHKKNKTPACKGNDEDAKSLYKGYIHSVMKNWACKGNMCWKHKSKRHCKHTLHLFSSHEQG